MNIVITGLGIIGGSFAKAIKNIQATGLLASTAVKRRFKRRFTAAQLTKSAIPSHLAAPTLSFYAYTRRPQ